MNTWSSISRSILFRGEQKKKFGFDIYCNKMHMYCLKIAEKVLCIANAQEILKPGFGFLPKCPTIEKVALCNTIYVQSLFFYCFRGLTNGFICILLKCTCTNVSSAILSLLSLIEMRKCICDSDFSQNVPKSYFARFRRCFLLCVLLRN